MFFVRYTKINSVTNIVTICSESFTREDVATEFCNTLRDTYGDNPIFHCNLQRLF